LFQAESQNLTFNDFEFCVCDKVEIDCTDVPVFFLTAGAQNILFMLTVENNSRDLKAVMKTSGKQKCQNMLMDISLKMHLIPVSLYTSFIHHC